MVIFIACDDFTMEDVTALGRWLRERYRGPNEKMVHMFVQDGKEHLAEELAPAIASIWGDDPHDITIVHKEAP